MQAFRARVFCLQFRLHVRGTCLEQVVALGYVLESLIQARTILRNSIARADSMRVHQFCIDWRDDVALRDDDGLSSHRRRLVRRGSCLHNFLQMRWQVYHLASAAQISLVCVDL